MLILEYSQGCYEGKIWPCDLDLWAMTLKIISLQIFLRTKFVPGLVKIHWKMLILECSQGCYAVKIWPLEPLTLKINRVSDSPKDYECTKFGQNPLKDLDSRVFTRMLCGNNLTLWPWKSIGFQTLLRTKYVPSLVKIHWRMLILVFTRMLRGKNLTPWPLTLKINRVPDSSKD